MAIEIDGEQWPRLSIELTQGKVTWLDADDYAAASEFRWCATETHGIWYAVRRDHRRQNLGLHNFITGQKFVDHKDGDGLNNCRYNLPKATITQNNQNRGLHRVNTSGFKGVCWDKDKGRWRADIQANGRRRFLGYCTDPVSAALRYDRAALELHSEFALTNQAMGLLPEGARA